MFSVAIGDKEIFSDTKLIESEADAIYNYTVNMEKAISWNQKLRTSGICAEGMLIKNAIIKKGLTILDSQMAYRKVTAHHNDISAYEKIGSIIGGYAQSTVISTALDPGILNNWGGKISYHIILTKGTKFIKVTHKGGSITKPFDEYLLAGGAFYYKALPIGINTYAILYKQEGEPSEIEISKLEIYGGNPSGIGRVEENYISGTQFAMSDYERIMMDLPPLKNEPERIPIFDIRWDKKFDKVMDYISRSYD